MYPSILQQDSLSTFDDSYTMLKHSLEHLQPSNPEYYADSNDFSDPELYCICQIPYNDENYISRNPLNIHLLLH